MFNKLSALNHKTSLAVWKFINKPEKGQALSEYAALIGIVVGIILILVVIAFRDQIVAAFRDATSALRSAR